MKKCVFTVITGNYIDLVEDVHKQEGWDYICITDDEKTTSQTWKILYVEREENCIKIARHYKTNWFKLLDEYEILMYIDGRIGIIDDFSEYAEQIKDYDIVFLDHRWRTNILQEMEELLRLKIEHRSMIETIKERYASRGYKYDNGLVETGVMLFKNNSRTKHFFKDWWYEIDNFSHRDQLSANYAIHKNPGLRYKVGESLFDLPFFEQQPRGKERSKVYESIMIHTYIPYCPLEKGQDLGWVYNNFMKMVGEDDWVCFLDHDATFTTKYWYHQLCDIIKEHPEYGLFTAMTNRLGNPIQVVRGVNPDIHDMAYHRKIGKYLEAKSSTKVADITKYGLSGVIILISKKTWNDVGGFKSGFIGVDGDIHGRCRKHNIKVGLMVGFYVYHWYRADGDTSHVKSDISHLLDFSLTPKIL